MTTWSQAPTGVKAPPYTEDVTVLRDYIKTLADIVAIIAKDVSFILNGNVDGKNIKANSIEAKYLSVDELSAISADLGTITAGIIRGIEIYGSYIATSEGTYPRAELNSDDNLVAAYASANEYAAFIPIDSFSGAPTLAFIDNILSRNALVYFNSATDELKMVASNFNFVPSIGGYVKFNDVVKFPDWSYLINIDTSQSLQDSLNSLTTAINANTAAIAGKANRSTAGVSLNFDTGTRNLKLFNADGAQISIVNIPT